MTNGGFDGFKGLISRWLASGVEPGTVYRDVELESLGLLAARSAFGVAGGAVLVLPALAEAEEVAEGLRQWSQLTGANLGVETLPEIGDVRRYIPENEAKRAKTLFSAREPDGKVFVCAAMSAPRGRAAAGDLRGAAPRPQGGHENRPRPARGGVGRDGLRRRVPGHRPLRVRPPRRFVGHLLPRREHPARVEFWGDQIETIRLYTPETQRAFEKVGAYQVIPRGSPEGKTPSGAGFLSYFTRPRLMVAFPTRCEEHLEKFAPEGFLARWRELTRPGLYKNTVTFLDPVESAAADHAEPSGAYQPLAGLDSPLGDELGQSSTQLHEQLRAAQLRQWLDNRLPGGDARLDRGLRGAHPQVERGQRHTQQRRPRPASPPSPAASSCPSSSWRS